MSNNQINNLFKQLEKKDEKINDLKYEIYLRDSYIEYLILNLKSTVQEFNEFIKKSNK